MTQAALFPNDKPPPHNLTGVDFHAIPPRKIPTPIFDAHTHCNKVEPTRTFLAAADAYNISKIWTMAPLEDVDPLNEAFPNRFRFIAIPDWRIFRDGKFDDAYASDWMNRLDAFYEKGARLVKFHFAPGTKHRWNMHPEHPLILRVMEHAYKIGYHFMTHVSDPKVWFTAPGKYANLETFGSFESQFAPLERMLARYPDRIHMGAHMGGCLENIELLDARLRAYPNYCIDTSATKWITRAVAQQPLEPLRAFLLRHQDRILFGSDLVVNEKYDWDHYASRYWSHQMMWETNFNGLNPIEDPDSIPAKLVGLNLPESVLEKIYHTNAERWLPTQEKWRPDALINAT